jgi:hypothetical protein
MVSGLKKNPQNKGSVAKDFADTSTFGAAFLVTLIGGALFGYYLGSLLGLSESLVTDSTHC